MCSGGIIEWSLSLDITLFQVMCLYALTIKYKIAKHVHKCCYRSRARPTLVVHLSLRYFKGELGLFGLTLLCALLSLRSYIIQTILRVLEFANVLRSGAGTQITVANVDGNTN